MLGCRRRPSATASLRKRSRAAKDGGPEVFRSLIAKDFSKSIWTARWTTPAAPSPRRSFSRYFSPTRQPGVGGVLMTSFSYGQLDLLCYTFSANIRNLFRRFAAFTRGRLG